MHGETGVGPVVKAVYVSHSPADSAGAELALIELVEGIIETASMELHLVVPAEGPLFRRLTSIGVPISVIPHLTWTDRPSGSRLASFIRYAVQRGRSVCRIIALVRRLRCDVVVSNTSTVFTPAVAAKLMGVPHVWYVHEFGVKDHDLRYDLGFERSMSFIGKLSRMVLVPSRAVSSVLEEWVDPDKIKVIPCAVHGPSHLAPFEHDGEWRLVLVGRKSPGKGQTDAVDAVAALRRMGHPVRLRLVGGGEGRYVESLRERARRLDVDQYVEFVEPTPQVVDHYRWAQIVLMCSNAEAFGRVTVEAMKYGRPVVGADAAGTAELIRDGETGVLYRSGDAEDLAAKIVASMSDPERMAGIAHRGQEWAERSFSLPISVAAFTSILHEAMDVEAIVRDGR